MTVQLPAQGDPVPDTDADVLAMATRRLSPSMRIRFPEVVVDGGRGATFWTASGRKFLDLHSMAAIMNIGYGHPAHLRAVHAQVDRMIHCNPAYVVSRPLAELAERLAAITPGAWEKRVVFGLSGSDANDGAIKLARAATGRQLIIAFHGAYHGNTYGALSLSAVSAAMRHGFGPTVPGVFHAPYPRVRSSDSGSVVEATVTASLAELRRLFATLAPPEDVAAIFIEPVQGDSGIFVPPVNYMRELASLAAAHGILVVAEEVQTGIGRTGKMFACEQFAIEPDLLVMGKALGGGIPISAVVARSELMDAWSAPGHVFSTSAGPLAAAAASAVLRIVAEDGLLDAASERGAQFKAGLEVLAAKTPQIRDVRGMGLMLGVELDAGGRGTEDATRLLAAKVVKGCFNRGCFLTFLTGSVLRIMPPLVISAEEVDRALCAIEESLTDAVAGKISDADVKELTGW